MAYCPCPDCDPPGPPTFFGILYTIFIFCCILGGYAGTILLVLALL